MQMFEWTRRILRRTDNMTGNFTDIFDQLLDHIEVIVCIAFRVK